MTLEKIIVRKSAAFIYYFLKEVVSMKNINWIVLTLVIIGALNWGLIGFFGFDLVTSIFGGAFFWIARIIFAVVGLAGIYALTFYKGISSTSSR